MVDGLPRNSAKMTLEDNMRANTAVIMKDSKIYCEFVSKSI